MSIITRVLTLCAAAVILLFSSTAWSQCSKCHEDWTRSLQQNKIIHSALEDDGCEDCHDDHGDNGRLVLVEDGNNLCLQCHDGPEDGASVHEALSDGDCTDCHDPHGSNNSSLLVETLPELCFQCHDDPGQGKSVHEVVSDGSCTDCHDPHASKNSALLVEGTPGLCLQCHDVPENPGSKAHTALTEGDCTDCHRAHASEEPRLLVEHYETKRFPGTFVEEMYSLCFQCHEAELVTGPARSTGFRSGSKNLHNLHVMGELKPNKYGIVRRGKARSCSICHQPHGSEQGFNLVKEYRHNGILFFALDYTPTENGGRCVVGCHKPRSYSRSVPQAGKAD